MTSDYHVVHGALGRGGDAVGQGLAHGRQQHVGDALGGLHVAAGHAALGERVHQTAPGRDHLNGPQAALVGRGLVADHAAYDVETGRHRDGAGSIDAAGPLLGGPGEVDLHPVAVHGHRHRNAHRLFGETVVVHVVGDAVGAVGDLGDAAPGQALRVVQQRAHVLQRFVQPIPFGDFRQALIAHPDRRYLRGQVALSVFRGAGVPADEGDYFLVDSAAAGQFQGRDDHPLLVELGGQGH